MIQVILASAMDESDRVMGVFDDGDACAAYIDALEKVNNQRIEWMRDTYVIWEYPLNPVYQP